MLAYSPVVLCGKNATRDRFNQYIRQSVRGFSGSLPNMGEKIICRKNNWAIEQSGISLTNGLTGTVMNQPDVSSYNGKSFLVDFAPDITSNVVFNGIKVDYKYLNASKDQRDIIKQNGYYEDNLFEFGYTQTVHLAQGSQWSHGMYIEEYIRPEMNNHLHYTALTRFSNMCIYVKQKRKFGVNYGREYYQP